MPSWPTANVAHRLSAVRLATAQADLPAAGWMLYPLEKEESEEGDKGRPEVRPTDNHPEVDCLEEGEQRADSVAAAASGGDVTSYAEISCDNSSIAGSPAIRALFGPVQRPQPTAEIGGVTTLKVSPEAPGLSVEKKRELSRQQRRRLKRIQKTG